jgi:hypothetical protein
MNRHATAPDVGPLFFPQSQSLGIDHGTYSPQVLRQIVYAGVQNTSFAAGQAALLHLARLKISAKQVERVTERIGQERIDQRQSQVQAFRALPVVEKFAAPVAPAPDLAVVSMDGGRLQIRDQPSGAAVDPAAARAVEATGPSRAEVADAPEEARSAGSAPAVETRPAESAPAAEPSASEVRSRHWREDKVGLLMTMTSAESAVDPCPTIPSTFINPLRIPKLVRALRKGCAPCEDAVAESPETEEEDPLVGPEYAPPEVRVKSMVATRHEAESFGVLLAAAAHARGFYGARRKAFVADGAECNWAVRKRWFSDFVAILDFIHALSYIFAAAMAGRGFSAGWEVYVRWIGWVWQGRVEEVIRELEPRQADLGLPDQDESETSPRRVVADALRYLKNHHDQMRYDEYRRLGLPITSSHVESTVKQINRRVKGTEKFWSEEGAEALLQLRADYLSETEPMEKFWQEREMGATGRRCYRRAV